MMQLTLPCLRPHRQMVSELEKTLVGNSLLPCL